VVPPSAVSRDETKGGSADVGDLPMTWHLQDALLRDLWKQNLPPMAIAEKLNRTVAAVMTRAARLGLRRRFAPGRKAGQRYEHRRPRTTLPAKRLRKMVEQGMALPEATNPAMSMRICLMCLKKFLSTGRDNRICPECKGSSEYAAGTRIPDTDLETGL
jgi:hypothetical protein